MSLPRACCCCLLVKWILSVAGRECNPVCVQQCIGYGQLAADDCGQLHMLCILKKAVNELLLARHQTDVMTADDQLYRGGVWS